jgi:serine/threonine-protein kinase
MNEIKDVTRIKLARKLAEGGMGSIYEAVQMGAEGFQKTMAVKTILEDFSSNKEFVEMFIGEAKLVADLVHQNIVQIYQLGKLGNMYYIAMEYIEGVDLGQFIDKHAEMKIEIPIDLAIFIISRVCRGLEYAHGKTDRDGNPLGVVHRDISPGNVMLAFEGVVKITDFGIAKARNVMLDQEGEVLLGKIHYMSPEQAQFMHTDGRSDLFSLGIVFYEILTGKPLFQGENTIATLESVTNAEIKPIKTVNPKVPDPVVKILEKALQRDRNKRYQSAGDMGYDLEYYMYHDRFGPTNITLAKYLAKLYPERVQKCATSQSSDKYNTGS